MALLNRKDLIGRYNKRQLNLYDESVEKSYSKDRLRDVGESFSFFERYDIFLSHSFDDARVVRLVKEMLEEKGFKVYVDWIEDEHLDRGKVTATTAYLLRNRMDQCSSLIYLTSLSAQNSLWMPWELGYMDAKTRKVSVAPIMDDEEDFEGREYLGLYPYLDLTNDNFYIHDSIREWVNIQGWMAGEKPKAYT